MWEVYLCSFFIIVDYVSACICISIVVSWLYTTDVERVLENFLLSQWLDDTSFIQQYEGLLKKKIAEFLSSNISRHCLKSFYQDNYLILAKYVFMLFHMVVKQNDSILIRGLTSEFSWLRSANHEIYRPICDVYEECRYKKNAYEGVKNGFTSTNLSWKRHSLEWKHTDSPIRKKFWA